MCARYPEVAEFLGTSDDNTVEDVFAGLSQDGALIVDWATFCAHFLERGNIAPTPVVSDELTAMLLFDMVSDGEERVTLQRIASALTGTVDLVPFLLPRAMQKALIAKTFHRIASHCPDVSGSRVEFDAFIAFLRSEGGGCPPTKCWRKKLITAFLQAGGHDMDGHVNSDVRDDCRTCPDAAEFNDLELPKTLSATGLPDSTTPSAVEKIRTALMSFATNFIWKWGVGRDSGTSVFEEHSDCMSPNASGTHPTQCV
eukprot:NODE_12453_length_1223_cov_19.273723.p1 GENE.NODE_12453_length_1223_cov_19.273723~~NODE_12453_length_1223_cov_19.273723.p1  ORF type:complete len:280 (-),score=55.10 NODE_12453_length_1223_cov_19.273723:383-1150(-)